MRSSCRSVRRRVIDFIEGELSADDVLAIESHIEDCEPCRREVQRQRRLDESLLALDRPQLTPDDFARWTQEFRRRREVKALPGRRSALWRVGVAAAATAAALVIWVVARSTVPTPLRDTAQQDTAQQDTAPQDTVRKDAVQQKEVERETEKLGGRAESTPPSERVARDAGSELASSASEHPDKSTGGPLRRITLQGPADFSVQERAAAERQARLRQHLLANQDGNLQATLEEWRATENHLGRDRTLHDLASLLTEEDTLALHAAELIAASLDPKSDTSPAPPSLFVIAALDRSLNRPSIAAPCLNALASVDQPSARRAVLSGTELDWVREPAVLAVMSTASADLDLARERLLLQLLRSPDSADQELLQRSLGLLHSDRVASLQLAATLHAEGLAAPDIAGLLQRIDGEALQSFIESIRGRGPLGQSSALALARIVPLPSLVPVLVECLRRGDQPARCADALAAAHGTAGWQPLARLLADSGVPVSRKRLIAASLRAELARASIDSWIDTLVALGDDVSACGQLIELCGAVESARSQEFLLATLEESRVDSGARAAAALGLAAPSGETHGEELLAFLGTEVQNPDLIAVSVLITLYRLEGMTGLSDGCRALGFGNQQSGVIARRIQRAARRGGALSVDDLERLAKQIRSS